MKLEILTDVLKILWRTNTLLIIIICNYFFISQCSGNLRTASFFWSHV